MSFALPLNRSKIIFGMGSLSLLCVLIVSCTLIQTTNGYQSRSAFNVYDKNAAKIVSDEPMKHIFPSFKTRLAANVINNNLLESSSRKYRTYYEGKKSNSFNTNQNFIFKGQKFNSAGRFQKKNHGFFPILKRKLRDVSHKYNDSQVIQKIYQNLTDVGNALSIEDINLNLNWQKFLSINQLGYHLSLGIDGKDEGKWTIVGDSKPEYILSRLKPDSSYTVNIKPVSCKLLVEFNIKTPKVITDEEAISLINMIHREENNLTNIRNIAITFRNSAINSTGYILEVELLTRYNEGSKTVVVQIVNLLPGIELITVYNLKPCSIYKFNIRKEDRDMLELSRGIEPFQSFYVFTGNTDNFKSNFPLNNQNIQTANIMHSSFAKQAFTKHSGVMPRRTVTCYVENESPFSGFPCRNSDICVPMNWVCDGEEDCEDGDDEQNCMSYTQTDQYERSVCRKNEFRCYSRGQYLCLPISWLCDGQRDCDDGWDENTINCRKSFNRPGSTLYHRTPLMCERDYFRCFNGLGCIAPSFVCDGDQDCRDGSDEWKCKTNSRCNSRYEFQCFYDDASYNTFSTYRNHRCIPKSWVCDDQDDCPDGEDESFETCNLVRRLGTTTGLFSVIKNIVDPINYF